MNKIIKTLVFALPCIFFVIKLPITEAIAGELPRIDVRIKKIEITKLTEDSIVKISAEVVNKGSQPFRVDPSYLMGSCAAAKFMVKGGVNYEIANRNIIDGEQFQNFVGDRVLKPMQTNAFVFEVLAGEGGMVPVNREIVQQKFLQEEPTNLTYIISGLLRSQTPVVSNWGEVVDERVASGYGKASVTWRLRKK